MSSSSCGVRIQFMVVRIVGAGAVGTVVARKLYSVSDCAFIVDEERKERYKDGLVINGERIVFDLRTPVEADEKISPGCIDIRSYPD